MVPWPRLHLASRSARRRLLLAQEGIEHDASSPGVDDGELEPGDVEPAPWVVALAYYKAAAAKRRLANDGGGRRTDGPQVILGADTVVLKGRQIIGQPRDAADAERIVRLLQDGEHEVLTGVALLDAASDRRDLFVDRATVRVGHIGDERIAEYMTSGQWAGKAGAYNLSERLAAGWPITYTGDPTTIMGLPMKMLIGRLRAFARGCTPGRMR